MEYIEHWEAFYKIKEKDSLGIERDVWESKGADHYALASVYFRLALYKTGDAFVQDWEADQKAKDHNMSPDVNEEARKTEVTIYE